MSGRPAPQRNPWPLPAGQFTGEVNMLSAAAGLVRLRASEAGEVIEQAGDHLLGLVHTDGEPSRSSWRAFILRRVETIACAVAPCPPLVSEVWMHCEPGPAGGRARATRRASNGGEARPNGHRAPCLSRRRVAAWPRGLRDCGR